MHKGADATGLNSLTSIQWITFRLKNDYYTYLAFICPTLHLRPGARNKSGSFMSDQRLASLHLTIEYAVSRTLQRFKNLQDKDIEWVFEQYRNYFQALRQGKVVKEPDSTRRSRSELMDFIWECLIRWEEAGGPVDLLDGNFRPGGRAVTMVEELYVMAFNELRKSCRLHRKADGPRGYIKFVQGFVAQTLEYDPTLEELLNPDIPLEGGLNFEPLLDKRGYRITVEPELSGILEIDELLFEGEEEASFQEVESLVEKYPDNELLLSEYAVKLKKNGREEEAIALWKKLQEASPRNPYYVSAYIDRLLRYDEDLGFEEAERLNFQFELDKYSFDSAEGYSIVALLCHSSACITMALLGRDIAYALELFDDLVRTGLPPEFLYSIGSEFILYGIKGMEAEDKKEYVALDELASEFPNFSAATDFIEEQWEVANTVLSENLTGGTLHNYPNAFTQDFPWPRNPGTVESALQLRVHILDSAPEIYRIIVVPDDTLLPDLHGMLQVAFDWEESHLHEFIHEGVHFEMPHEAVPASGVDSRSVRVGELLKKVGDEMIYHYDFGDSWKHQIVLEAIPEVDDEILYPRCLAGARRGPMEDSGGIHRYQHILKVLEDPEHPEYTDFKTWLGPDFDPAEFVLAWTHKQLWKGRFWSLGAEDV